MNIATELNAICRDIEMGVVDGYRIHSFLDFCLREKHQGRPSLYRSSRQSESVEQRKAGQSGRIQVPRSDLINDQLVVQLRRAASQAGRKDRDAAELLLEAGKRLRKLVDQYCEIHGEPIPEQSGVMIDKYRLRELYGKANGKACFSETWLRERLRENAIPCSNVKRKTVELCRLEYQRLMEAEALYDQRRKK